MYSIVTNFYRPSPERLRDWISVPKGNGYEALHTTVMGPGGRWVEVQIRTGRMNEIAEKGLAAHWKYKEGAPTSQESKLDSFLKHLGTYSTTLTPDTIDFIQSNLVSSPRRYTYTPQKATCAYLQRDYHTIDSHLIYIPNWADAALGLK